MKESRKEFTRAAIEAALKAGAVLIRHFQKPKKIRYKGEINLVTQADRLSERVIVDHLHKNFKNHKIITEEEYSLRQESDYQWLVDPLDGTTNFAHSFPVFCVSIALLESKKIIAGVIYQPLLKELFVAEETKGAHLNGKPIRVSNTTRLDRSLLATGFPYDIRTTSDNNLNHFCNFALSAQAVRRAGAAALDLAYTAAGRFDGFWELKLHPWDIAAGIMLVQEAGGAVTDFTGGAYGITKGEIVASNGRIHPQMTRVLQQEKTILRR
jgi:myo-inositol-1(or 4)-monophosphatase